MREDKFESQISPRHLDTVAGKKQRLADIARLGQQLHEIEQNELMHRSEKFQPDPKTHFEKKGITRFLDGSMDFIRNSLSDKSLMNEALKTCYELMVTSPFEARVAERIADTAPALAERLSEYPRNLPFIIEMMASAHEIARSKSEDASRIPRSALKIQEALERVFPSLQIYFSEANPPTAKEIKDQLQALGELLLVCDGEKSTWILPAMSHLLVKLFRSKEYIPHVSLKSIIETAANAEKRPQVSEGSVTRFDIEILLNGLKDYQSFAVLCQVFNKFGLPPDDYLLPQYRQPANVILDQMETISELEAENPGSAGELYSRFGIRWFSRYPTHVLQDQYQDRENANKPYGVFLSATSDWTGAFFSENDHNVVESIARQLKLFGYALRIVECSGMREIGRRFISLDASYGAKHKMDFVFVRAHGGREVMTFGRDDKNDGRVDVIDLSKKGFLKGRQFLSEGPTIIFDGCSVGRRTGLGRTASETFDATVLGPKGMQSSLTDIRISKEGDKLKFDASYEIDESKKRQKNVPPHMYVRGRKR